MTDMRDITSTNEVRADSVFIDTGVPEVKESYTLDDSGGLGEFHRPSEQTEEISSRTKMLGGVALALMIGAAGAIAYSMYGPQTEVVADNSLPRTSAPQPADVTPMTPPPPATDGADESMVPAATEAQSSTPTRPQTAMSPPAAPELATPAPRNTQQRVANAPRIMPPAAEPATPAPSPATVAPPAVTPPQQTATVPEPVSPTPPASAVAGNPPLNEQSAAPVEAAPVTPAEAAPADVAPAPSGAQPAQPSAPLDQSQ